MARVGTERVCPQQLGRVQERVGEVFAAVHEQWREHLRRDRQRKGGESSWV